MTNSSSKYPNFVGVKTHYVVDESSLQELRDFGFNVNSFWDINSETLGVDSAPMSDPNRPENPVYAIEIDLDKITNFLVKYGDLDEDLEGSGEKLYEELEKKLKTEPTTEFETLSPNNDLLEAFAQFLSDEESKVSNVIYVENNSDWIENAKNHISNPDNSLIGN